MFGKIFEIQNKYLSEKRVLTTQTHIVSDFDDEFQFDAMEAMIEKNKNANINFECHWVVRKNKRSGEDFKEAFQKRVKIEAKTEIKNEEKEGQFPTRSSKKRRSEEKMLDSTFSEVNPDEFTKKKQKRDTSNP